MTEEIDIMAHRDWFGKTTALQRAIERGLKSGGDLAKEIRQLGDYSVNAPSDAEAICLALENIARKATPSEGIFSGLHAVTGLFQEVPDAECAAFRILRQRGCRLLIQILEEGLRDERRHSADDLLFVLKILALYGSREGTEAVIRAALMPFRPDGYMWSVILAAYGKGHPDAEHLFEALSRPLPSGFVAVALLDAANQGRMAGEDLPHPFDSAEGKQRLRAWLTDPDPDHFSYAHSATATLAFISNPEREQLLTLALNHPSVDVQLEAAWAAAKLGRDAGLRQLIRYCHEVNYSDKARRYLAELDREELIPSETLAADFQAKAEFAQWLAHPNELGRAPDEMEIIDHRELRWPPDGEQKPFWLIKYRLRKASVLEEDDVDVGLVGSITFCLFSYRMAERPPEDCYAIHGCWEMEGRGLIREVSVEEGSKEYDGLLRQWGGNPLEGATITHVAELSPELGYPGRLVALASAWVAGEEGWVVLDGPRSTWYLCSEMPSEAPASTVLKVHIGRELLGFRDRPDRKRFLAPVRPGPALEQVVEAYERLLDEACNGTLRQREKLLGESSLLGSRFNDYVAAREKLVSPSKAAIVAEVYERLLVAARGLPKRVRKKAFDSFRPLGKNFDAYRDALIELGRPAEVLALVKLFEPYWDHNLGYGVLASAAYKAGGYDVAERFCTKLRRSMKEWYHCEEMGYLAEIWHQRGRDWEAKELLTTCLRELLAESRRAEGSDKRLHEDWFQHQRSVYLRLFPERGAKELEAEGIPATTLS